MLDTKFEIVNGHQGIQWPWIISRNSQAIKEMWLTSNTPTMLVSGTPVMFIGGKSSNKEAIEVRCKKIVTSVTEQLEKREIKQTIDYINEKKIIYGIKSIAGKLTNFRIPSGSSSFETATEPKNLIITFKNGKVKILYGFAMLSQQIGKARSNKNWIAFETVEFMAIKAEERK